MGELILCDRYALRDMDPRDWHIDKTTGFLVAYPRVARTGIQVYGADEVDPEGEHTHPGQLVKVYRPADEVFNKDSMASFVQRPITNDHPGRHVTAKSWKKDAVGNGGGEVARDGEYIRLPLMVCDQAAVNDVEGGKKQFSVGYGCLLDWTAGKTSDGEEYDCVQRKIRVNHIAVVGTARGGPELALDHGGVDDDDDNYEGDDDMANDGTPRPATLMQMVVDGLTISVPDAQTQSIINKSVNDREAKITALTADLKTSAAKIETLQADAAKAATVAKEAADKLTAENATLKKQAEDAAITPEKLDAMVKDRADVASIARQVMPQGKTLVTEGRTIGDIRKQVVMAKMGDSAKDWTDAQVETSFVTMTAGIKAHDAVNTQTRPGNSVHHARDQWSNPGPQPINDGENAYAESNWIMENQWRGQSFIDANITAARASNFGQPKH